MIPVARALELVLAQVRVAPAHEVPLGEALGRVLAADVAATAPLPPFANSGMDGYAVRAADLARATAEHPVRLPVGGEALPGQPPAGPLVPGTAWRIMTGAPLPEGADAVVRVEDTAGFGDVAEVRVVPEPGEWVRPAGEDVRAGQVVLRAGQPLTPARIGMLAAVGRATVAVHRPPRVGVLATGDELVPAGEPLAPGRIHDSNGPALVAAVLEAGAVPVPLGIAPDTRDGTRRCLEAAIADCDVLLTSGGVSMGRHDHVGALFAELGEVHFTRVAQQPGKPLTFATLRGKPVFGLPGNPVSTLVCFEVYVRPALRKIAGHAWLDRPRVEVQLERPTRRDPEKTRFLRATVRHGKAALTGPQGSNLIHSLVLADALVVIPPGEPAEPISSAEALVLQAADERV